MRKNNVDQQAGITQDELLTILEQSGRPNFTKRRLTQLTSEHDLGAVRTPQLHETSADTVDKRRASSSAQTYISSWFK